MPIAQHIDALIFDKCYMTCKLFVTQKINPVHVDIRNNLNKFMLMRTFCVCMHVCTCPP